MTDKPDRVTVTVLPGDAMLIIKDNGDVHLGINTQDAPSDATLLVLGLTMALDNDEWRQKLIARTVEKLREDKANAAGNAG